MAGWWFGVEVIACVDWAAGVEKLRCRSKPIGGRPAALRNIPDDFSSEMQPPSLIFTETWRLCVDIYLHFATVQSRFHLPCEKNHPVPCNPLLRFASKHSESKPKSHKTPRVR